MSQTYTMMFNFEEEEEQLINEIVKYVGEENVRVLDYGVFGDGSITNNMKSIWVKDEFFSIAYTAMHFAYFLDKDYPFNPDGEVNLQRATYWHNRHLDNPKRYQIEE